MRKITFLMLLISSVILCPTKSQAQMQSVMVTSTQRTIDFNLSSMYCELYLNKDYKLLDIRHSAQRVAVLGQYKNGFLRYHHTTKMIYIVT